MMKFSTLALSGIVATVSADRELKWGGLGTAGEGDRSITAQFKGRSGAVQLWDTESGKAAGFVEVRQRVVQEIDYTNPDDPATVAEWNMKRDYEWRPFTTLPDGDPTVQQWRTGFEAFDDSTTRAAKVDATMDDSSIFKKVFTLGFDCNSNCKVTDPVATPDLVTCQNITGRMRGCNVGYTESSYISETYKRTGKVQITFSGWEFVSANSVLKYEVTIDSKNKGRNCRKRNKRKKRRKTDGTEEEVDIAAITLTNGELEFDTSVRFGPYTEVASDGSLIDHGADEVAIRSAEAIPGCDDCGQGGSSKDSTVVVEFHAWPVEQPMYPYSILIAGEFATQGASSYVAPPAVHGRCRDGRCSVLNEVGEHCFILSCFI